MISLCFSNTMSTELTCRSKNVLLARMWIFPQFLDMYMYFEFIHNDWLLQVWKPSW